jgi:hypothetical protein
MAGRPSQAQLLNVFGRAFGVFAHGCFCALFSAQRIVAENMQSAWEEVA